ncbi:hypothetical protein [Aequorivita ciconiae]|uniref:hypothetical protein n=1 Tax=Aequorivita ciconiae TaxID=2494375 RepID=UPI00196BA30F|nr:hypothetical protein [Aequorivita sp. H23M31]
MKKLLLVAAFAVFAFSSVQAQQMKVGVNAAIPMGDYKDLYSFGLQGDFTYFFEVNDAFLVGPQAGLLYYMGKDVDFGYGMGSFKMDDAMFLPIGASARYLVEDFFFGADLGYGIGLAPDGNDGGFFYRPKAGYNFGSIGAVLSYSGVSMTGASFNSLNLGVEFSF